ncbi:MAG TPA: hypothetical protein PKD16_02015 [Saprospiraceae bacterium]|jgi:hypothetical protein|nr:hypothetical protein [Saprospiraceae bacterium]
MVNNRAEAVEAALRTTRNVPNTCQLVTRGWFNAPSVGDFDGDGAADAEDGWKSEPVSARHSDRNPPAGVPVSYLGGSRDNGHRAISLGGGRIRSTDAGGSGVTATVDLAWPERAWGLKYVGWSETIDGIQIPPVPPVPPVGPKTRGENVDEALKRLARAEKLAKDGTTRDTLIKRALAQLAKIKPTR